MGLLLATILLLAGCGSCRGIAAGDLPVDPFVLVDLGESMRADATLGLYDEQGNLLGASEPAAFQTPIMGRFGAGAGVEIPLGEGVSLRPGVLWKRFRPGEIQGLAFETVSQWELFLALRLRPSVPQSSNPWAEIRLGAVPRTPLDSTFDPGGALERDLAFRGDAYGKVGVAAGWEWRLSKSWVLELGALLEHPLGSADASEWIDLGVPGIPPVESRTTIEPFGWTISTGIRFSP